MGIEVDGLTKSFGSQKIWEDVTVAILEGEVSVLLGRPLPKKPSATTSKTQPVAAPTPPPDRC